MERRYEARLKEMLAHAEVPSDLIDGLMGRLETFVELLCRKPLNRRPSRLVL